MAPVGRTPDRPRRRCRPPRRWRRNGSAESGRRTTGSEFRADPVRRLPDPGHSCCDHRPVDHRPAPSNTHALMALQFWPRGRVRPGRALPGAADHRGGLADLAGHGVAGRGGGQWLRARVLRSHSRHRGGLHRGDGDLARRRRPVRRTGAAASVVRGSPGRARPGVRERRRRGLRAAGVRVGRRAAGGGGWRMPPSHICTT